MENNIVYTIVFFFLFAVALQAQEEKMCPHPDTAKALMAYEQGKSLLKSNIDSSIYYMNKAKDIFRNIKCWEQMVKMSYNLTVIYGMAKDEKKAEEEIRFAQQNAQTHLSDSSRWKGKILMYLAEKNMNKKAFDEAATYLTNAQIVFRTSAAWKDYITACRMLSQVYLYKQDFRLMERSINDAFKITKEKLGSDPNLVKNLLQLYGALYYRTGDFESALERTLEGLDIVLKNMKTVEDTALVASYYNNVALFYLEIGDVVKAEDYGNNALNLSIQLNDKYKAATIYMNLAEFFFKKSQIKKAFSYYTKGIELMKTVGAEVSSSNIDRTMIQMNLGIARTGLLLGKKEEAQQALEQNLSRHNQESYKSEMTYMVFGSLYAKEKEYDKADAYLKTALSKALSVYPTGKHPDIADIYYNLAIISSDQNKLEAAQGYAKKAIESLYMRTSGTVNVEELSEISDKDILIKVLEKQADWLQKQGKLKEASDIIYMAAKLTDELKNTFKTEGSKLFFLQRVIPVYEKAFEIAFELHKKSPNAEQLEKVFQLVEKSKSILLLDALRAEEARAFGDVPDALLKEERRLSRELAKKQKSLYEAQATMKAGEVEKIQQEILNLRRMSQKLQDTLEIKYNNYYKLKYNEKIASIKEVQNFLSKDAVLLEFFVGNNNIYLFSISKKTADIISFPKDAQFDKHIKALRLTLTDNKSLSEDASIPELYELLTTHGFAIYDKYLKKAIPQNTKELIVVSDGLLNYIPFEALLTEKIDAAGKPDFKKLPYLLHKYDIHYHYSASMMLHDVKKSRSNGRLLAMAPTYAYDGHDHNEDERQHKIRSSVDELPGAKQEVASLSKIYKGTFLYGLDANEKSFKELTEKENFAVIHLAMHGWVDENRPPFSNLVLSHTHDNVEDNLLHAYELNLLKLNADLVVLSACETGFGKYERGEGVVSIGRGFMYAGVPSLIMTLWPINDRATALLVTEFYEQLSTGKTKSEALRAAKLAYLEVADELTAHPFFWASFISVGEDSPIRIKRKSDWMIWLLWASLSVAFIVGVGIAAGRVRKSIFIKRSEEHHHH